MRRFLCVFLCLLFAMPAQAADHPTSLRVGEYLGGSLSLGGHWGFSAMLGHRAELSRRNDPSTTTPRGTFLFEAFVGPVYSRKLGPVMLSVPLQYYYTGFPVKAADKYFYTHSFELMPSLSGRLGPVTLSERTILHNTFYASLYDTPDQQRGYSLFLRQLVGVQFGRSSITPFVTDEIFVGMLEDEQATPSPAGFPRGGLSQNRFTAGVRFRTGLHLLWAPQYWWETAFTEGGEVSESSHYFFLQLNVIATTLKKS